MWIGFDALVFALCAALLMCAGPWYVVRRLSEARRQKIEDQLADAMVMFSSAIRAGLSIPQSLELLAVECPKPISQEFTQISGAYKLGKPLERTLTEAKDDLKSENFVLFAAARLERKVRAETAQARKSAVYMAIVPAILLVVYYFVDPQNTELLFVTLPGQIILSMAGMLNLIAYLWALKILNADI
jgi:tight adherence protein B